MAERLGMLLAAKHREIHDKKQMTLCGNAYTIQRILERVNIFLERVIAGNVETGGRAPNSSPPLVNGPLLGVLFYGVHPAARAAL